VKRFIAGAARTILAHRPDLAELVAHVRADLENDGERCPDAEGHS
jgi:hypothetical protein